MEDRKQPQVTLVVSPKSLGMGLLLVALFGPLGMLYSTITGAIVMFVIAVPVMLLTGLATLGFGLIIVWPIILISCAIWAAISINRHNEKLLAGKVAY